MTERVPRTVKVDRETWDAFVAFVVDAHGSKRGNLGREFENALAEYMDRDRYARIESKVDEVLARLPDEPRGHTHTPSSVDQQASESVQKVRAIADRVYSNHAPVVRDADVERAIEDIAGGHKDTIAKYEELLRKRGLLWEHPDEHSPVWTTDRKQWAQWVDNYEEGVPSVDLADLVGPYPVDGDEFAEIERGAAEA